MNVPNQGPTSTGAITAPQAPAHCAQPPRPHLLRNVVRLLNLVDLEPKINGVTVLNQNGDLAME